MRSLIMVALVLGLAAAAAASDLGNQAPVKVPGVYPINIPNPVLQGGDTIANATVVPGLPYNDSGTTVGYNDDYNSTCYFDNGAPDVVYSMVVPAGVTGIVVQLCGSTYDTGLQILDSSLVQVACNDDFCGLQSKIEFVPVTPGMTYYVVVDGYSSASGSYVLNVARPPYGPCFLSCPRESNPPEVEPALNDDYVDNWNGGCNTPPGNPFQHIAGALPGSDIPVGTAVFCGVSGWYQNNGVATRDTDWFLLNKGAAPLEITADAEYATYIFELAPRDCASVAVAQQATAGPCTEAFMTITSSGPDGLVWFWVGPTVFSAPGGGTEEYDYIVMFTGLVPEIVGTESTTWGDLKALYE